jgi:hypothetical protein
MNVVFLGEKSGQSFFLTTWCFDIDSVALRDPLFNKLMTRLHCNKFSHSAKFGVVSASVNAVEFFFYLLRHPKRLPILSYGVSQRSSWPISFQISLNADYKINLLDHTNISFLCILITKFMQCRFSTAWQKVNGNEYKENTKLNGLRRTTCVNKCERQMLLISPVYTAQEVPLLYRPTNETNDG